MRIDWNNLSAINSIGGISAQTRTQSAAQEQIVAPPPTDFENSSGGGQAILPPGNLTPETLRAALLGIGISADADAMEIADAFARLGLPLTDNNINEGRTLKARFPKLPAAAFALAKLIDAPISRDVLRALARVIDNTIEKRPLDEDTLGELSLALNGEADSKEIAKELYQLVARFGRSTEQRLIQSQGYPDALTRAMLRTDPRALLLDLAMHSTDAQERVASDAFASHIEGQQLLNVIALRRFDPPVPLYFAFPVIIGGGKAVTAEIQVWTRDEDLVDPDEDLERDLNENRMVLQTVVRLSPPKLGRLEVRLEGRHNADLNCTVLVEQPATYRLLHRSTSDLAAHLADAGWIVRQVEVGMADAFNPLWYGGAALTQPRGRVDQNA